MRSTSTVNLKSLAALVLLLSGCPTTANRIEEARALQDAGRYEASLGLLRDHLHENPNDPEASFLHGLALSALARPSEAEWPLREAMRSEEWAVPSATLLARDSISTGNYHSALQASKEILKLEPSNMDGLQLRATAAIMSRKAYEEALVDADRMIELEPDHPDAGVLRAIALLGLNEVEEAEAQLVASAELRGERAPGLEAMYCVSMAEFFTVNDNLEQAEKQLERCREQHPDHPQVISEVVQFYDAQGRGEESLEILEAALADKPRDLGVRSGVAQRLARAGQLDEADRLMLEATGFGEGIATIPARIELQRFYTLTGRPAEAADALSEAVELIGDSAQPQMKLALVEARVGLSEFDKAEAVAKTISDPSYRAFAEANIAIFQRDYSRALELYTEGYKTWPNSAAARYYGAYAAERLGLFDRAIDEYRYSIRSDPAATDARQRLATLFMAEGEYLLAQETILVDSVKNPLPPEGIILAAELGARQGKPRTVAGQIALLSDQPGLRAEAVAGAARGIAARSGPANAARFIEESKLDLRDPRESAALRALVTFLGQTGEAERAGEIVRDALKKSPRAANFHEIQGLLLERYSARADLAIAAYDRALELSPDLPRALAGKARLKFDSGSERDAIELFAKANSADPEDSGIARAYAAALALRDQKDEAKRILENVLEENPADGRAALALGRIIAEQASETDTVLALAERATRFAPNASAFDFLADRLEASGDLERAAESRSKAAAYREQDGKGEPEDAS